MRKVEEEVVMEEEEVEEEEEEEESVRVQESLIFPHNDVIQEP